MSRKIEKAQNLLESVQILNARVERWSNEMDRCRALVERINGADPSFPVVQKTLQPSSGAEWDAYLSAKAAYEEAVDEYVEHRDKVMAIFDKMENVTYMRILELRYLNLENLSWEKISSKLHFSPTWALKTYDKALEHFAECLTR